MSTNVFEPLVIRNVEIRNRLWVPPMCQYSVDLSDGVATSWHLMHYGALARGGFGLVTVEATGVVPEGRITPGCLGIWTNKQAGALHPIAQLIKSQGAVPAIQLAHAGRKGSARRALREETFGISTKEEGGWTPVAPSPIAFTGLAEPTELTTEEIDNLVEAYVAAAERAQYAGFEVLEIHAAHGYLLHEFLSPVTNKRTDEYGGSLENRASLLRRIVREVRGEVGENTPIFVRLSATEWVDEGFSTADIIQVAKWVKEDGADLISVTSGGNVPSAKVPEGPGYHVPFSEQIRSQADIPTAVAGVITGAEQAEEIVASGAANAVYIGREALRNPNFPHEAALELGFPNPYVPTQYHRAY